MSNNNLFKYVFAIVVVFLIGYSQAYPKISPPGIKKFQLPLYIKFSVFTIENLKKMKKGLWGAWPGRFCPNLIFLKKTLY